MFNYDMMNRKERERKEDEARHSASKVVAVNTAYRNGRHQMADRQKHEVEQMQARHDNEHRQSLIKMGAPLGTPPHHFETKRMRIEGRELDDRHCTERGDAAEKYEHDLEKARAADAQKQVVKRR